MRCIVNNLMTGSLLCLLLGGCASRHAVILVPDPGGQIGKAEVTTAGGRQLLERASDMTRVSGPKAPSPVTTAAPEFIAATFADALAVEPLPSEKFILFFDTGATALASQSQATVAAIVDAIKRRGAISIAVSGHADAAGSVQLNDRLALERAEFVKELLLREGVSPERVIVTSHGSGNPLVPTPDGVAEPKNRRVEVVVR